MAARDCEDEGDDNASIAGVPPVSAFLKYCLSESADPEVIDTYFHVKGTTYDELVEADPLGINALMLILHHASDCDDPMEQEDWLALVTECAGEANIQTLCAVSSNGRCLFDFAKTEKVRAALNTGLCRALGRFKALGEEASYRQCDELMTMNARISKRNREDKETDERSAKRYRMGRP